MNFNFTKAEAIRSTLSLWNYMLANVIANFRFFYAASCPLKTVALILQSKWLLKNTHQTKNYSNLRTAIILIVPFYFKECTVYWKWLI